MCTDQFRLMVTLGPRASEWLRGAAAMPLPRGYDPAGHKKYGFVVAAEPES